MRIRFGLYSRLVNLLCIALLAGSIIYLVAVWGDLPDQIPGHYDFEGNVTRYDGKGTLFVLPIVGFALFILFSFIERFPQLWNTGVRITEENKIRVYRIITNMLVTVKLSIIVAFTFLSVNQSLGNSLPGWFIGAFLLLLFAPVIFFIIKLVKAR